MQSKRALIICSSFYPENTPGSHRVAKMAKYLPAFGWTPVVLCPDWNDANDPWYHDPALVGKDPCDVVRASYPVDNRRKMRKAWLVYSGRFFPHLAPFNLCRNLQTQGLRLLKERRFDAILASCPPTMVLTVADRLAGASDLPLVVDFRDIPDELGSELTRSQRRQIRLQTVLARRANALITVSAPLATRLTSRLNAPVRVICNGYDPCDFPHIEPSRASTFDIVYCGGFTAGRDPSVLFAALDKILERDSVLLDPVRVCFYGCLDRHLAEFTRRYRCIAHLIHNMGRVSHTESIRRQQQASVLLLLSHRTGFGVMTSKVFEYLAAGRPILSVPGDDGVTDALLRDTGAGVVGRSVDETVCILRKWLAEWKRKERVECHGRPDMIKQYSRRTQAGRLAEVLDGVVEHHALTAGTAVSVPDSGI